MNKKEVFETYKQIIFFCYDICYASGNALISAFWGLVPYFVLIQYGLELNKKYYGLIIIMATIGNFWFNYKNILSKKIGDNK